MKTLTTRLMTRSLSVLGLGCTLAALPLTLVSAQDNTEKAPTAASTPMPSTAGSAQTGSSSSGSSTTVEPKHVKNTLTAKEKEFMHHAAGGNEAEVQMAQLALKNGESSKVKEFAQMMIDDHGAANKKLEQVAQDKGVLNFRPEMSGEDKALFAKMSTEMGSVFDTDYVKHAVADHETDVEEYKQAEKDVQDAELKAFTVKSLKTIEGHLKMAKEMK